MRIIRVVTTVALLMAQNPSKESRIFHASSPPTISRFFQLDQDTLERRGSMNIDFDSVVVDAPIGRSSAEIAP
jgi:hypothetical protein